MKNNPKTLQELRAQIIEAESRKNEQESALRTSVHQFAASLKPEKILLYMAGKLVAKWLGKQKEKEEKETELKGSVLDIAKRFASEAIAKGIDLLAGKLFP